MVPVLRLDRESLSRHGRAAEARVAFAARRRRPALALDTVERPDSEPAPRRRDPDDPFGR